MRWIIVDTAKITYKMLEYLVEPEHSKMFRERNDDVKSHYDGSESGKVYNT
jgi:hypothetical protein